MREIKFRAWDGKKMYYWDSVDHPHTKEITRTPYPKLFYLPMSFLLGDSNDWVWMQYTGLKDRNGKEIYEGDVLSFEEEESDYRWVSEVVFEDCAWKLKNERYRRYLTGMTNPIQYHKVIGNVYENPELCQ